MNVAQAVLTQLSNWGVTRIYGLVGDHIFELLHQLNSCPNLTFYPVRHEETASLMASAHAKLTGEIGVCLANGGPGAVHLLNGVADAYKDQVPLLAITGEEATKDLSTEKKQVINQSLLFSGLTCYCGQVLHQESAGDVIMQALSEAAYQCLPAHVSIPKDILSQPYQGQLFGPAPYLQTNPQSPPATIAQAAEQLSQAKRPAIIAGKGGTADPQDILALAEKLGAPLVLTSVAKPLFPWEHPQVVGGLGDGGSDAASQLMNSSDMVIAIGANWWPEKYLQDNLKIIQIDSSPISLAIGNPIAFGLVGDIRTIVQELTAQISPSTDANWTKEAQGAKEQWLKTLHKELGEKGSPCPPASVINALNETVPADAILALDVGDHFLWFNRLFKGKGQQVLLSGKWRTMGFGLPAALAAKINYPQRPVVALVGDGGFVMTMADFLTAVKLKLPVVVVVMNNESYAMEQNKMTQQGLTPYATDLYNPDFKKFAESCGGEGYTVKASQDLIPTLQQALASNKPCILDVQVTSQAPPTEAKNS